MGLEGNVRLACCVMECFMSDGLRTQGDSPTTLRKKIKEQCCVTCVQILQCKRSCNSTMNMEDSIVISSDDDAKMIS